MNSTVEGINKNLAQTIDGQEQHANGWKSDSVASTNPMFRRLKAVGRHGGSIIGQMVCHIMLASTRTTSLCVNDSYLANRHLRQCGDDHELELGQKQKKKKERKKKASRELRYHLMIVPWKLPDNDQQTVPSEWFRDRRAPRLRLGTVSLLRNIHTDRIVRKGPN